MKLHVELVESYLSENPRQAAAYLESHTASGLNAQLKDVAAPALIAVLDNLTTSRAGLVFGQLDEAQQRAVISLASPRLAVLLLNGIDETAREALLSSLQLSVREDLERILEFPESSAGRLMTPAVDVRLDMGLEQVKERMRIAGVNRARSVYVVDEGNRLIGRVDMQDLALAESGWLISDFLQESTAALAPTAPRSEIVEFLNQTRLDSVPIVDIENRLLGVVRHQKLFEAIESVANADMQKMVGGSADERALSTPSFAIRRRLPWLHINLLTAFLAAAVVGLFDTLIAQFTALAVLLPVVAGQSGNAGAQALAVTVRGLALKEIGTREWPLVLKKELTIGLVNGVALAVSCGLGVYLWSRSIGLAIVIAVAMVLSMIAAGISGALVPIILTRLGQDPATASSIILTTVTDVAGFMAFLGTATLLVSIL